ncbi:MAG: RidA family protein [Acidobacteria bacterium]|nr:RidA family protein [Acidobacteriota bacterium]
MRNLVMTMMVFSACLMAADKKAVFPEGASPAGPYSPGMIAGDTLYCAGQVGRDKDGKYPAAFEDEVKQTLENIGAILKKAGYTFEDAVSVQVHLTDIEMFARMNQVYMTYFPEPRPARTTVGGVKLVGPARIEITVTAYKKKK